MKSIRWKLILLSTALVCVPLYAVNRYAIRTFDSFSSRALEDRMVDTAYMAGRLFRVDGGDPEASATRALIQAVGEEADMRIQILSPAGRVWIDTGEVPEPGVDLSDRAEVAEAVAGRYKARWALTEDRDYLFYYCALPVEDPPGQVSCIAYVSRHTSPIVRTIRTLHRNQRGVLLGALAFAAMAAALVAQTLTSRLRKLNRLAAAYAQGETRTDFSIGGRDEIAELAASFRHMTRDIERRNRYNHEFVSTVSHELKAPLTAIRGAAELLLQGAGDKPEARERFLANILSEAERMDRMAGELRELTRLDADLYRGERVRVDYRAFLPLALARLETLFDPPRARLDLRLPEGSEPLPVRIMPDLVEQLLYNLLDNAFRYTPPDGCVRVRVQAGPGDGLSTVVEDSGSGIAEADLPRIFDRYFSSERKGPKRAYGSGLGLAIARRIVEAHQGRIQAENRAEGGAVFRFDLPRA